MDAWLPRAARMHPERTALATAGLECSYSELEQRARAAAGAMRERGVRAGDRVALELDSGLDFAAALHGCLLLGAAAVPIDVRLAESERLARSSGARALLDGPLHGAPLADEVRPAHDLTATVMHTSGTTAAPKAVELSYANWQANALGSALALGLDPAERWLCPIPLVHVGGLAVLIRSSIYATTAVLQPRFDLHATLRALLDADQRITLVSLVPTQLMRLLDAGLANPPTLRWVLLGGGPISPALLIRASAAGVPVAPSYGMTETCSQIATRGWPLLGAELAIDAASELLVRGPMVSAGALAPDGWLHTGDLAAFDRRGRVQITGRKLDTIITGGENVAPAEVEAALLSHAAVLDAAVHARADPEWGEAVVATVVLRQGSTASAEQLIAHCTGLVAKFKVPKAIRFADELPRTPSGKLIRRELPAWSRS